jgi:hypothetical protein
MQLKKFVRLLSAAQGNPLTAPAEKCKFPVQLCKHCDWTGSHWMEFTVKMLDHIRNNFLDRASFNDEPTFHSLAVLLTNTAAEFGVQRIHIRFTCINAIAPN